MFVNVKVFIDAEEKFGDVLNHAVLKKVLKQDARMKTDVVNA